MKNKTTALLLSIFLGGLGIDRFYLGYTGLGILKLLTGGCFGILWLIDIILIATGELKPADGSEYEGDMLVHEGTLYMVKSQIFRLLALLWKSVNADDCYFRFRYNVAFFTPVSSSISRTVYCLV